jgi:hypothetical protein
MKTKQLNLNRNQEMREKEEVEEYSIFISSLDPIAPDVFFGE